MTKKIEASSTHLDADLLANCCFALYDLGAGREVRALVEALHTKVAEPPRSPLNISKVLFGLADVHDTHLAREVTAQFAEQPLDAFADLDVALALCGLLFVNTEAAAVFRHRLIEHVVTLEDPSSKPFACVLVHQLSQILHDMGPIESVNAAYERAIAKVDMGKNHAWGAIQRRMGYYADLAAEPYSPST